ncbi:transmembrane protein 235 [Coregonus clupeaformis]|uniref:transmembrane protein 235 n=1 Tax=Coregonus clupeaformis TaxID=59861 RepID=UPI001BE028AD|nr:transmembrane protein 235 [Coregonus clupeaformis]
MKLSYGSLVVTAGIFGILSFAFLAAAIGSDYWYIIEVNRTNRTDTDVLDSHSGLWITYEGQKVYSYTFNSSNYSEPEMHMLNMHSAIVVLLPLSLVLLVFGGICGLISSLARSPVLLTGTASYLLLCSVLTLSGVSLYISYSQQALAETERLVGAERLAQVVSTSFGWSLSLAWLSFCLEVLTGLLLLLAACPATLQDGPQGHGWPLHVVT